MRRSLLRRACTLATAVAVLTGTAVATAPSAGAAPIECRGDVQLSTVIAPMRVEVMRDAGETRICYYLSVNGAPYSGAYRIRDSVALVDTSSTFDCVTQIPGSVGDPNDPGVYVQYRLGLDVNPATATVRFCAGVESANVTLHFDADPTAVSSGTPQFTAPDYDSDPCADTPRDYVFVDVAGVRQETVLPLYWLLFPEPAHPAYGDCLHARTTGNVVVCRVDFTNPVPNPVGCDLAPETHERIAALVELVENAPGTVFGLVDGVINTLGDEVDRLLNDPTVRAVLDEVDEAVATALAAVGAAQETVNGVVRSLPVRSGSDMGNCTASVAVAGPVAVWRSPTGAIPASVCVVTGTGVTRLTIG